MRRLAVIAVALALAMVVLTASVLTSRARSAGGPYTIRAIFDDAAYAVTGENVRIAGANVGTITALGVTPQNRAAVTITIDDNRFTPFFSDAHCEIRPQSLIGEEYVDCTPGSSRARPLQRIRRGPGAGDYLLPVTRTSSPINTDIVQNISTQPVRESLAIIIGELGTGLAARGSDLNAVIHRANPALGNTEKVLRILASQNRTLADLASSSAKVLGPLARERRHIAGFIRAANTTARATAQRAADISRTFHQFPRFLAQLRPLMSDLGTLSSQGTPVMRELGQSATPLSREFAQLTPFARAARSALISLGRAARRSQADLVASQPLARRLLDLGRQSRPSATSLATLLQSLNSTGGIEDLMLLLYRGVGATNGFDSLGHYARVDPLAGSCSFYARSPIPGCAATFSFHRSPGAQPAARGASGSPATSATSRRIVATAVRRASAQSSGGTVGGLLSYLVGAGR
ncbi:MAG TPA: MlaD family protein [Solirubrobacteraceae bacterium]|nr:MlaD family protein [Solirubrobacteraceae bacterium]